MLEELCNDMCDHPHKYMKYGSDVYTAPDLTQILKQQRIVLEPSRTLSHLILEHLKQKGALK
jgi:hypothetical protein